MGILFMVCSQVARCFQVYETTARRDLPPGCARLERFGIGGNATPGAELGPRGCPEGPSGQMREETPSLKLPPHTISTHRSLPRSPWSLAP